MQNTQVGHILSKDELPVCIIIPHINTRLFRYLTNFSHRLRSILAKIIDTIPCSRVQS